MRRCFGRELSHYLLHSLSLQPRDLKKCLPKIEASTNSRMNSKLKKKKILLLYIRTVLSKIEAAISCMISIRKGREADAKGPVGVLCLIGKFRPFGTKRRTLWPFRCFDPCRVGLAFNRFYAGRRRKGLETSQKPVLFGHELINTCFFRRQRLREPFFVPAFSFVPPLSP